MSRMLTPEELAARRQRAQRAYDDLAMTRALRRMNDQATLDHIADHISAVEPALTDAVEVLQGMCAILDDFPIEWQVTIVKALVAHTMLMATERLQPRTALSA